MGLAVACAMDETRMAIVDREHRVSINWETFFFADADNMARFNADPTRYCDRVTDPVTQVRFQPTPRSPRFDYKGRTFYFTSDSTRTVFKTMPDSLAVPHFAMRSMGES